MARLAQVSREASVDSTVSTGSCILLDTSAGISTAGIHTTTPEIEHVQKRQSSSPTSIHTAVVAQRRRSTRIVVTKAPRTVSSHENNAIVSSAPELEARNRTISGETLVEGIDKALDLGWKVGDLGAAVVTTKAESNIESKAIRQSVRLSGLARAASAIASKASTLGKRSREMMENGKEKLQALAGTKRSLRPRTSVNEIPDVLEPPRKKAKLDQVPASQSASASPAPVDFKPIQKESKQWLAEGLYVGKKENLDPLLIAAQTRRRGSAKAPTSRTLLPIPMFEGRTLLDMNRDFRLPFDLYSPSQYDQTQSDWKKLPTSK